MPLAARQTVNNELSALRRGFRLAIDKGLLAVMPKFTLPKMANARSGFFEEGEFAALLLELPADVRDMVQFLRATGWRRDEGRLLPWAAVDREAGTIRLEDARSKSGKPCVFPFGLAPSSPPCTVFPKPRSRLRSRRFSPKGVINRLEARQLSEFRGAVQEINRGLDIASAARAADKNILLQTEVSRLSLKCRNLLDGRDSTLPRSAFILQMLERRAGVVGQP